MQHVVDTLGFKGGGEGCLRLVPYRISSQTFGGTGGQFVLNVGEAKIGINPAQGGYKSGHLILNLFLGAENMAIILIETAYPHDAVEGTGRLVAVTGSKFAKADRQFTVTAQVLPEYLNMAWAIHWLDGILPVFRGREEHVFLEIVPVARGFPQSDVQYLGAANFLIAILTEDAPHVLFDLLVQGKAVGMPENHAGGFFLGMEEIQGFANFAMIPLLGFFQKLQVGG